MNESKKDGKILSFGDAKEKAERARRFEELKVQYVDISRQIGDLMLEITSLSLSISGRDSARHAALVIEQNDLQERVREIREELAKMGVDERELLSPKD
jgi:tRNA 2-selenouridine synthase SelU